MHPAQTFGQLGARLRDAYSQALGVRLDPTEVRALMEAGLLELVARGETKELTPAPVSVAPPHEATDSRSRDRPFNVAMLADHWSVSRSTIYNMINSGRLNITRYGGRLVRISAAEVRRVESDGSEPA